MRFLSAVFVAMILMFGIVGCKRPTILSTPDRVSKIKSTPLPVLPPPPDSASISKDVANAANSIALANQDLKQVLEQAQALPAAQSAIVTLTNATTRLSDALQSLASANADIKDLNIKLKASEDTYQKNN